MGLTKSGGVASRFSAYIEGLASVIGHAGRAKPLRDYCTGLMMPCDRKSVEPMAAMTAPERTAAQHQALLHFVGQGDWSDQQVLAKIRELVLPGIERHGEIEAWIIDDTGFPKKGRHSVGVARQYCGQLGKQDNCQVAVTLSLANHHASLPVAYRLYLPREWVTDRARRHKAGVPREITFKTKPAIALDHLRWACAVGLPRGVVLMDAGYGTDTTLRGSITELGLSYVAASCHKPQYGRSELDRVRRRSGRGTDDLQNCYGVIANTDRFQPKSLRSVCQRMLGTRSRGVKVRQNGCLRVLPVCASVRHIEITGLPKAGRRNGC
jgi:SRSO17 transposase